MKIKKIYKFLIILLIIIIVLLIKSKSIYVFETENKQIYLIQISSINSGNVVNKFQYYNENGKIIKEEKFEDSGDVSYSCTNMNYIYSFGPGGLYKTDSINMETIKLSDEDINIVKFYNNKMYYFVNNGFKSNGYESKICTENECIKVDFFILDFAIYNNKYYILGMDSLYVYNVSNDLIKKIDLSDFGAYQKILEIQNKIFIVNESSFYEIKEEKIEFFSDNNIIKDLNFKSYKNSKGEQYIIDNDMKKILKIELLDNSMNIKEEKDISSQFKISYAFNLNERIGYRIDYEKKEIIISELNNNILAKFNINIHRNEAIFKIYKLK
ncbi:MAG: hypothetical protein J6A15_07635 [Clostridia bacterium]|nr:hypothetical protein [Clostridia bacterium]MBQ8379431.1 hypothetical protein [Clostridia bacterium]